MGVLIRALACALLLFGCFAPGERDGVVACAGDGSCPPGFQCNEPDRLCYRDPPGRPDASRPIDAAVIPDAVTPDAPPPDATPLPQCSDGVDNDCDGRIDDGVDPGCDDPADDDEHGTRECDDGVDNDEDGDTDFQISSPACTAPTDSNCTSPFDDNES